MKIIFLDIDGVLNSAQYAMWNHYLDRKLWSRWFRWLLGRIIYHPYGLFRARDSLINSSDEKLYKWFIPELRRDLWMKHSTSHYDLCPISTSNLRELLAEDEDVMIVVSSTWRSHGLKQLRKFLKPYGIDPKRVIDVTGYGPGHSNYNGDAGTGERGHHIQEWLNRWESDLGVTHFSILDDDSDMDQLMDNLVLVDNMNGFTWRDFHRTAVMLNIKGYVPKVLKQ